MNDFCDLPAELNVYKMSTKCLVTTVMSHWIYCILNINVFIFYEDVTFKLFVAFILILVVIL